MPQVKIPAPDGPVLGRASIAPMPILAGAVGHRAVLLLVRVPPRPGGAGCQRQTAASTRLADRASGCERWPAWPCPRCQDRPNRPPGALVASRRWATANPGRVLLAGCDVFLCALLAEAGHVQPIVGEGRSLVLAQLRGFQPSPNHQIWPSRSATGTASRLAPRQGPPTHLPVSGW